jgi:CRP/FNR family transcriptional regulator
MGGQGKNICSNCEKSCFLQKYCSVASLGDFSKSLINITYKRKETIIKQKSHSTHLIYLKSGLVKSFSERRNNKNVILKIHPQDSLIGVPSHEVETYNYTSVALKDCEICLLPKEHFFKLLEHNNMFVKYIFESYVKYSILLADKLLSLGTKQMHGRLADTILYLCSPEFSNTNVFETITRKDISEMSGMSSESAIRLLTEFKNDGLIKTDGKMIEINNIELLNRLSEIG